MKNSLVLFCVLIFSTYSLAQEQHTDIKVQQDTTILKEVILVGQYKLSNYRQEKTLSSIDDYLEKSNKATMIKRGNYAWEPTLNNMTSERLNLTIDGMQIFGACTDKMDPITSYVDVSNLDQVSIQSGQEGTENGHSIGGGIDLQLSKSTFYNKGLQGSADIGYETNGNYKAAGLDLNYSTNSFYINVDGIYRNSDNYKAGNDTEIMYSQFEKYNISLQTGYKLNENNTLNVNFIYDQANNVGYPALPMDVSLAKASIGSIAHTYSNSEATFNHWETKLYYNTITHVMDDSKRPDVPIRMDMPGWSDTYGFYTKAKTTLNDKHHLNLNINGYYNRSLAEMTMYPNNPNEADMFMYTWPDVRTLYTGIFAKDHVQINENSSLTSSIRFGFQNNHIASQVGLESLQIFYPDLDDSKQRFLTSITSNYQLKKQNAIYNFSLGYGERAPSVSEGYGFFLFNSFDNYDYIGNPLLKNEKSLEANAEADFNFTKFTIGLEASYFHILDYIIGETDPNLSPMTIGADGVRIYTALDYATIFDTYLNTSYRFTERLSINASIGYNYGSSNTGENLPLIKPFSYLGEINYKTEKFNVAVQVDGNGNQSRYSSYFGESETADYAILNLNFGNVIDFKSNSFILKYGVENVLDAYYSTYADWNNIPRQGRNFYANISYIFR
ncbi:TonB-dependent receptor [Formosa haliotis]|uniref:TonB-dependent receptor n=1 Tax=Formosa haliotis TaxID=1555194 RepID=UPI0008271C0A|nr:TonB-dependent receptor [Formosa haliotis]